MEQKPEIYYKAVYDYAGPGDTLTLTEEVGLDDPALNGPGMLCFTTLLGAVSYQSLTTKYCEVTPLEVISRYAGTIRCRSARVIKILDPLQLDRLAGFKLLELNLPRNPLTLISMVPVDAVLPHLPEWVNLRAKLRGSVQSSVENSTREYGVQNRVAEMLGNSGFGSLHYQILPSMGIDLEPSLNQDAAGSIHVEAIAAHMNIEQCVKESVRDAVWAYVGGLFPNTTRWANAQSSQANDVEVMMAFLFSDPDPREWKYAKEFGPDPWRPLLTLWYAGYVPSFDGAVWRLHTGPEAVVAWEGIVQDGQA